MNKEVFIEELKILNITLNEKQLNQLEQYYQLLVEWNEKINLTSIVEKEEVYLKHFYDSITMIKIINLNNVSTLCDIGTGAGFPGIVLKIVFPNLKVTLVDSLNKRIHFLNIVIDTLNLKGIQAIHARAEEFSIQHKEQYDIVTARAVSHLSSLLEMTVQAIKIHGYFVAMKANVEDELMESKRAMEILNMRIVQNLEFDLPIEHSKRTLIKLEKEKATSNKYPRKYSEIKKKRL